MIRTAVKGLAAHWGRMTMTALAVVLGVAFVAGTFVFTDSIRARFDNLFRDVYAGVDVVVRPQQGELSGRRATLPEELVEQVREVEGVAAVVPEAEGYAQLIGSDGEPVGGEGPPTFGFAWSTESSLSPFRIEEGQGREPRQPGEIVVDVATAEAAGVEVGDQVQVALLSGAETFTLVGVASFGEDNALAGATIVLFHPEEAQRVLGLEDGWSALSVAAAEGLDEEELRARVAQVVPAGVEVVTGTTSTGEQIDDFTEGLGFLTTALLAFAGVSVLVGAFIIQNTFRIVVAQRTRELALLRAVGATARRVTGVVVIEALVVGVVASALGVGAGVLLAEGLSAGMAALGFTLPEGPLTLLPRTVLVAMAVGLVVTLASALLPARKAAAVPPVAAMRQVMHEDRAPLGRRALAGGGLSGLGAVLLGAGLFAELDQALPVVAAGAVLVFLGVATLAPLFARPLAAVLGAPLPALLGISGKLAVENTRREPRRTAATASALMVGVALIAFVSVFASTISATIDDTLTEAFPADLTVSSANFTTGVPIGLAEELAALDEVGTVSVIHSGEARLDGEVRTLTGIDVATIGEVYRPDGALDWGQLGEGVAVSAEAAAANGWEVGEALAVEYPDGTEATLTVAGTFEDASFGEYLISNEVFARHMDTTTAVAVLATLAEGVELAAAEEALQPVTARYPVAQVQTVSEVIAEAKAQTNQLLALFWGLLGLAVVIAVIGIANTLALSILERTREIGLLRAVGMARRQVRRMIRWEAVVVAVFGALLGVLLGVALGWAVVTALGDEGLGAVAIPGGQLLVYLLLAGVAGVLAAAAPARRAARLDVLSAISYE